MLQTPRCASIAEAMAANGDVRGILSTRQDAVWHFAVVMEGPCMDPDESNVFGTTSYCMLVLCHQRQPCRDRHVGCQEYLWRIKRRLSDFEELDRELRAAHLLPPSVTLPKKTLFQHLLASKAFAQPRAAELHRFLNEAIRATTAAAATRAPPPPSVTAKRDVRLPSREACRRQLDCTDVSPALAKFLGLEAKVCGDNIMEPDVFMKELEMEPARKWLLPADAEERCAALVHSLDRGIFVWAHDQPGPPTSRLQRFDRQAALGDLMATYSELRNTGPGPKAGRGAVTIRRSSSEYGHRTTDPPMAVGRLTSWPWTPPLRPSPQPIQSPPSMGRSLPCSRGSTPSVSLLPSPVASPSHSRCPSPPRCGPFSPLGDDCSSLSSASTADTDPLSRRERDLQAGKTNAAVWMEVDLDVEWCRMQEQHRWWADIRLRAIGGDGSKAVRGASRIERAASTSFGAGKQAPDKAERGIMIVNFERTASLYRELAQLYKEELHPILGYGVEGRTFAVVQQAAPFARGLRTTDFTPRSCQSVLHQALKALSRLHEQQLPHGHLSPESILVEDGPVGLKVALAWTPGQRRAEGHAYATLGFRGPGDGAGDMPGDLWALACIILAWQIGFKPAPHPWTQFAKSVRLQQDIQAALAEHPPRLPQALEELHQEAMRMEDPQDSFPYLLAKLLTRCFEWQPSERATAAQLLQDQFFSASF